MLGKGEAACVLCDGDGKLVKAHVIPEVFLGELLRDRQTNRIYPEKGHGYPRRSPTGIYEPGLLCAKCDNERLGILDAYASELLLHPLETRVPRELWESTPTYEIAGFDYRRLKLFFISVLWRAHLSQDQFFHAVDLGPWQNIARQMILAGDPGPADLFGVILFRYFVPNSDFTEVQHAQPSPVFVRHMDLNAYMLRLADYAALIKVDKRPFPDGVQNLVISPSGPLRIVLRNYLMTGEFLSAGVRASQWEDFVRERQDAT